MFGAIACLVTTSAKDLCLLRVIRNGKGFVKRNNINTLTWIGCVALQKILALASKQRLRLFKISFPDPNIGRVL